MPSHSHTLISNPGDGMLPSYFNETGPIYKKEHVQAKEFVKLVRAHIVVENPDGSTDPGGETAWFDWEAFRTAVASLQASGISTEHELDTTVPPPPPPTTTTTNGNVANTTIQAVLDALVAQFAFTFTNVLFVSPTSDTADADGCANPPTHFFDTLRKNLYHAFTHHLDASDTPERCLSFYTCAHPHPDADVRVRSAWEYRLLFVHSDARSKIVRGLVMTVRLERRVEDEEGVGKEQWDSMSLDAKGPFSGALRAMQVVVGERFRYA